MAFKKYKGLDKYHIRVHKTIKHPSIIVDDDGSYLSCYDTTTSRKKYLSRKKSYRPLKSKLSGKDEKSYVHIQRKIDKRNRLSKPYNNSHLVDEDIKLIDKLELRNKKK